MNKKVTIRKVPEERAERMVLEYHYLNTIHVATQNVLGGFIDNELMGIMTLRWSIRPDLTIQKCFPDLDRTNYRLIGRLCTVEGLPQNAESHFISKCIKWLQKNKPELDVLYTWADGMMAKPGIVYQASNFWHGGFEWTESYITEKGERVHPANIYPEENCTNESGNQRTDRPTYEEVKRRGWRHVKAKQQRYVYFLCSQEKAESLRQTSPIDWKRENYPKQDDMEFKEKTDNGWIECEKPEIDTSAFEFQDKAKREIKYHAEQPELSAFGSSNQHWSRYECKYPPPYFETPNGKQ